MVYSFIKFCIYGIWIMERKKLYIIVKAFILDRIYFCFGLNINDMVVLYVMILYFEMVKFFFGKVNFIGFILFIMIVNFIKIVVSI